MSMTTPVDTGVSGGGGGGRPPLGVLTTSPAPRSSASRRQLRNPAEAALLFCPQRAAYTRDIKPTGVGGVAVAADDPLGGSAGRPAHPPPPTPPLDRAKRIYINLLNALFGRTTTLEVGPLSLHVFSDGFGSIEENIFSIYFTDGEIRDAGAVIDLGAHHCSFSVYAALKSPRAPR
ncbi:hypothetical protein ODS41_07710 [Pyrobaculum sp. 3827-6]|uniref:hypothetical protein n=1 Tax=Pyrobaculum sp. 3827-6 TaxID=2983604 RepID=UPI0021D7DB6B|nr:hypothetical protein [Pyrobaculum sp. 3827-6]MCU7787797.1 hypothetical protein [Pyrobaculum sp. 3827-6]